MILDTVKIEILYEDPEIGPGLMVPVDIKTANIDSEDLLDILRIALKIRGRGSLQPDPVPAPPAAAPAAAPAGKKSAKPVKAPGKKMKCPFCSRSMDTRTLHHHVKSEHPDLYDKEKLTRFIKGTVVITGMDNTGDRAGPAPDPAGGPAAADPAPVPPAVEFKPGMKVKQVKPDRGFTVPGTCTVRSRSGGLIKVEDSTGKSHQIDRMCLEVV
jgi:hypothetical protein